MSSVAKIADLSAMRIGFIIVFCCLLLSGCRDVEEKCAFIPETTANVQLSFQSLEDSLPAITIESQLVHFLGLHPELRDQFFNRRNYPNDSVFLKELYKRFASPHLDTLLIETHRQYRFRQNDPGGKACAALQLDAVV